MFYRFCKVSSRILSGLMVFFFSTQVQADGSGQVTVIIGSGRSTYTLSEDSSKDQKSQLAESFGLYFEWNQKGKILKILSKGNPWTRFDPRVSLFGESIGNTAPSRRYFGQHVKDPIWIETKLPVEFEGESEHPFTIVSKGGQIIGKWSSPSLDLKSENPSSQELYRISPSGVLDVQALRLVSGKLVNEGKILSSTSLGVEVISGELRNLGLVEIQDLLRIKEYIYKKGDLRSRFFNFGKIAASEFEVGNPIERFYFFQNGQENKGIIQAKKFFADTDYFINAARIHVPGRISFIGFRLENDRGDISSEGELSADFAQLKNQDGSIAGHGKTRLKVRENLYNHRGVVGAASVTELLLHREGQAEHLGKVQGTEIIISTNSTTPIALKSGVLDGHKSISIHSKVKMDLPRVQLHTRLLELSSPELVTLEKQKGRPFECRDIQSWRPCR